VTGSGTYNGKYQAFIARSPKKSDDADGNGNGDSGGMVGLNNYYNSLNSYKQIIARTLYQATTILHGSHGHPSSHRGNPDPFSVWASGDLAIDSRHDSEDRVYVGEVGGAYRIYEGLSLSLSLGKTWGKSKLVNEGSQDRAENYLVVEADIQILSSVPLWLTTTFLYSQADLDIKRGYDNAGSLVTSDASTTQSTQALRLRLQYQDEKASKGFEYHPFVEYNVISVTTDEFTEKGGGFASKFNAHKENVNDIRLGSDINYVFNEALRFLGTVEGVHRLESEGSGISGNIIDYKAFSFDGRQYDQTWLRTTVSLEQKITSSSKVTFAFNATTKGEDPSYWSALSYEMSF
jgi:hypothetical protein